MFISNQLTRRKMATPCVALNPQDVRTLRRTLHASYGAHQKNPAALCARLDELAVPYIEGAGENNFPQEDFLVLRLAGVYQRQQAQLREQEAVIAEEEDLIVQTASQALSVRVLDMYLRRMVKGYRALLSAYKIPARETDKRVALLEERAVRACLKSLLSRREWAFSLGVMRHYKAVLGEAVFRACAAQVRTGFAQDQAEQAWQKTDPKEPLPARYEKAAAMLSAEADAQLQQIARTHLDAVYGRAAAELSRTQSGVYGRLLSGQQADVFILEAEEIVPALCAAARAATEAHGNAPAEFNRLYFQGDPRAVGKAFEKGNISARDYLILMQVCYARRGGSSDEKTYALVQALLLFLEKNHVPAEAADEAVYAVLCAPLDGQFDRAQEIKKIYLLQENSK